MSNRLTDAAMAAAGGPSSQGLLNAGVLQALDSTGFLVDVAHGSLVEEAALVQALQQGLIAAAGLDVFAHEPHVPPGEHCRSRSSEQVLQTACFRPRGTNPLDLAWFRGAFRVDRANAEQRQAR